MSNSQSKVKLERIKGGSWVTFYSDDLMHGLHERSNTPTHKTLGFRGVSLSDEIPSESHCTVGGQFRDYALQCLQVYAPLRSYVTDSSYGFRCVLTGSRGE